MTVDGTPEEDTPIQAADLLCYVMRTFYEKDLVTRDTAHPRTINLVTRLGLTNHLHPDYLNRHALAEFARVYAEAVEEVGEWNWNAKKKRTTR
jgi:hypothetical protein